MLPLQRASTLSTQLTSIQTTYGKGLNQSGTSRLWIKREVENSLRRLQTDHIDLYQLHRPDLKTDIEETLGVLTDLIQEGKIRYIGSSTFQAWQIVESHGVSERAKFEIIDRLQGVAAESGMSLAHMALAFTQAHPSITSTIIGPRTIGHIQDTLKGVDIRLSSDILDAIDNIVPPGKTLDDLERGWAPDWLADANRRRA